MAWPLSQDYNEAIQDPQSSFTDPELRAGEATTNALGMPMPRSGNFADVYEFSDVRIDIKRSEVTRTGVVVPMSAREYQLLKYLVEHRDETISRDELLRDVWGYDAMPETRTVDVHMAWLRQKLEENQKFPKHFITVRGMGYRFSEV